MGCNSETRSRRHRAAAATCSALAAFAVAGGLAGCAAPGPDYVKPAITPPAAYKETGPWKVAQPGTADMTGNWWSLYGDPVLDDLVQQANKANLSLSVSEAQYRQARALVAQAQSNFYPTVAASASVARTRSTSSGYAAGTANGIGLQAAWEPDLWGRVRRQVEASRDNAQASQADLAGARLTIQAEVVMDYVQLRVTDLQKELYARTIDTYQKSFKLTQSQFKAGVVTRSDVALAQTTLQAAQAQAIDLDVTRNQLEHAIAVLLGKAPSEFSLAPAPFNARFPVIPAGLPSTLLERRPDIAGAERRAASANANIGVAQSAYYPSLTLSASGGNTAGALSNILSAPTRVWAIGAALAETLFDGGLRNAVKDQAIAAFDAASANYRLTVLSGFQEVEDQLAALRILDQETSVQDDAVKSAQDAERVLLAQYRAGTTTFLSVATAQALALTNERLAVQLLGRKFAASVTLVKAVGGGWDASRLASNEFKSTDTEAPR